MIKVLEDSFVNAVTVLSLDINDNAITKEFWKAPNNNLGEKLCLIHSEVSEALEILRMPDGQMDKHLPRRPALEVELADVVIRVMDFAQHLGLDLGGAIIDKHNFNKTRPIKHGKLF